MMSMIYNPYVSIDESLAQWPSFLKYQELG